MTPEQRALHAAAQRRYMDRHGERDHARRQKHYAENRDMYRMRAIAKRQKGREHYRAYDRARWDKEVYRMQWRRRAYGLSPEQVRDMEVGQAGRCLICLRVPEKPLRIDHDHATGRVRGMLCEHCNIALGHLRDDPRRADRAAVYLRATPAS